MLAKAFNQRVILVAIILCMLPFHLRGIQDPWGAGHKGFTGAFEANVARNYLRYGFLETGFGPVKNYGPAPEGFTFYEHHPLLSYVTVAAAFHVLGESEFAARFTGLLFLIANVFLLFSLARRSLPPAGALAAVWFYAFMPISTYYGSIVDNVGPGAVFFGLLILYFYLRWKDSDKRTFLLAALATFLVGGLFDWYVYVVIPAILIHHLIFSRDKGKLVWLLPVAAVALFLSYVAYMRWLRIEFGLPDALEVADARLSVGGRADEATGFLDSFLSRTFFAIFYFKDSPLSNPINALALELKRAWNLLGVAPFILAPLGIVAAWRAHRRKIVPSGLGMTLLLWLWPAVNYLVFPAFLMAHEYLHLHFAPAVAYSSAFALMTLWSRRNRLLQVALVALITVFLLFGLHHYGQLRGLDRDIRGHRLGVLIASESGPDDAVATDLRIRPQTGYYADRRFVHQVKNLESLADSSEGPVPVRLFITRESEPPQGELGAFLNSLPGRTVQGFLIYALPDDIPARFTE